jgi:hypothetical protein
MLSEQENEGGEWQSLRDRGGCLGRARGLGRGLKERGGRLGELWVRWGYAERGGDGGREKEQARLAAKRD